MKKVQELVAEKGGDVCCVNPDLSVFEALSLMAEKNIGALLVKKHDRVVGLISERDYARKVALENHSSRDTLVGDIMSDKVIYAEPTATVEQCMALMTDKHIRHLPVMEGDRLLGLVSIGDLVKAVIAEQQFMIEQLEHYISGGP